MTDTGGNTEIDERNDSSEPVSEEAATDADAAAEDDYSRRGFMETAAAMGAAGAAGLAGCSGSGGSGGGDGDGTSTDGEETSGGGTTKKKAEQDFLFWTMRGYIPEVSKAIKNAATSFEDHASRPVNVTANVIVWSQVFPKWNAAIQSRTTPNVSEMANEHAVNFGSLGAAQPITNIYNNYDDWYEPMDAWASWDGEKWGVPWFVETRPFYYRKDILNQAGYDKPAQNWKEFVHQAKDVAEQTDYPGIVEPGARDFSTGQHMFGYTTQGGGRFYSTDDEGKFQVEFDSGGSLFGHLFYASLGKKGWDIAQPGWTGMKGTAASKYFRTKGAAYAQTGSENARRFAGDEEMEQKVGIMNVPEGPDGSRKTFRGGSCLNPFRKKMTKHNVGGLDKEFIKYMLKPENQASYFSAAAPIFMPVREAQENMKPFSSNPTKIPTKWINAFLNQAQQTRRYGVYGAGRNSPFLGSAEGSTTGYASAISAILGADKDPQKALLDTANKIRSIATDQLDYKLPAKSKKPKLENAPDTAQKWIQEGNDTPTIWKP